MTLKIVKGGGLLIAMAVACSCGHRQLAPVQSGPRFNQSPAAHSALHSTMHQRPPSERAPLTLHSSCRLSIACESLGTQCDCKCDNSSKSEQERLAVRGVQTWSTRPKVTWHQFVSREYLG